MVALLLHLLRRFLALVLQLQIGYDIRSGSYAAGEISIYGRSLVHSADWLNCLIEDEDAMDQKLQDKVKRPQRKHDSDGFETMMMMMGPSVDQQTRVGQQREEDLILPLLGQLNLLRKMMTKVQRNQGSLMHLLPNNIQLFTQTGVTIRKEALQSDLDGTGFNLVKAFHEEQPEDHRSGNYSTTYSSSITGSGLSSAALADREAVVRSQLRNSLSVISVKKSDFRNLLQIDFEGSVPINTSRKSSTLPRQTTLVFTQQSTCRDTGKLGDKESCGRTLHSGIESYQTRSTLKSSWDDAADYYFKEDYTIVPKPRVVVYRDRNDQRKLMRLNELHKFSDGRWTKGVMEKRTHGGCPAQLRLLEQNALIESWPKRSSIDLVRTRIQFSCLSHTVESSIQFSCLSHTSFNSYAKAVLGNKSVDMSGKYGTCNAGAESVGVSDCNKVYKEAGNEAVMSISVDDCIDLDGMERSILAKVKDLSVISELLKHMSSEGFDDVGLRYVGDVGFGGN
ncbi:hypothetical protein Tco_0122595 [Tanacetum coccineum]